jgi:hypothetical protein
MYPDSYRREPSRKTPWVVLEPGRIFIMGRSIPENPGDFYRPVYEWVREMKQQYTGKISIGLGFEYINTTSAKWIYLMLKEIAEMNDLMMNGQVKWYFEKGDDDMSELGFILRSLVDCPFVVTEVDKMNRAQYEDIILAS